MLALVASACASLPSGQATPVPEAASQAFSQARRLERAGLIDEADQLARRAVELAPSWVAPYRMLQQRARAELRAPAALEHWRGVLSVDPGDARALYLAARLEGDSGDARFRDAIDADPGSCWAWHGLAWRRQVAGDARDAERLGRRGLAVAADPWERTYLTYALAVYVDTQGREQEAVQLMAARLEEDEVDPWDRDWLEVQLARYEALSKDEALRRRGRARLVRLIGSERITDTELAELARMGGLDRATRRAALARRGRAMGGSSPVLDALEAQLLLSSGRTPLGIALAERAVESRRLSEGRDGNRRFRQELPAYPPHVVVERWLEDLPRQVLDAQGSPLDPRLAAVARAARATDAGSGTRSSRDFFEALLGAGWYDAVRAYAGTVPGGDLDLALEMDRAGAAGQHALREVAALVARVDRGRARSQPVFDGQPDSALDGGAELESQEDLLRAVGQIVEDARPLLDLQGLPEDLPAAVASSPLIHYSIAGNVVHPGPYYSELDERLGAGVAGEPVPGLAALAHALVRFPLFGDAWGTPPDGALLRVVHVDRRSGAHLGLPWSGTVAICDGYDLKSRDGRRGARIAGAALHEGYWIELEALREEVAEWEALRSRFASEDGARRVAAALDVRGLRAPDREARRSTELLLGEGDRLKLAVMRDRGPGDGTLGALTLDDFVEVTAVHEEAHLCDRARYFPIGENFGAVLGLLWDAGFSPLRLMQNLEYRAQLVAFCASPDPRIALAEMLDAAERGSDLTPHAAGYRRLLSDLIERLDVEIAGGAYPPGIFDPERTLVHQLHRIDPEMLRSLGLRQAADVGLVGPRG